MHLISVEGTLSKIARQIKLERYFIKGLGETEITDNMYADGIKAIFGAIYLDISNTRILVGIISSLWSPYLSRSPSSHLLAAPQAHFYSPTRATDPLPTSSEDVYFTPDDDSKVTPSATEKVSR